MVVGWWSGLGLDEFVCVFSCFSHVCDAVPNKLGRCRKSVVVSWRQQRAGCSMTGRSQLTPDGTDTNLVAESRNAELHQGAKGCD